MLLCIVCLTALTQAQNTLTLAEADGLALKNHPQLRAAESEYLRSDEMIRQQQAAYYPTVNADITGSQASNDARIGAGLLTDSRLFSRLGYGITVSQLITDSGRTAKLVASSKLQARASREDSAAARDDVILEVHRAYYAVLRAEAVVHVSEETVKARQAVADQISELTRNKLRSQLDVSFSEANRSDAKLMLLRAQNSLTGAYASLSQALGSQQSARYQLVPILAPEAPASEVEPLVKTALNHRPELASMRLREESQQRFAEAEGDSRRPTVTLTGVAGFLPLIKPGNANPNIPAEYEGAAINVRIPIFNGHLFSARSQAASYQAAETGYRARDLADRIARDVRAAWGRALGDYQALAVTQQLLTQSLSALDLAQGRYNLGLASMVELTQAQLLQTRAQVEVLDAQFEYQQAVAVLNYEQGLLH